MGYAREVHEVGYACEVYRMGYACEVYRMGYTCDVYGMGYACECLLAGIACTGPPIRRRSSASHETILQTKRHPSVRRREPVGSFWADGSSGTGCLPLHVGLLYPINRCYKMNYKNYKSFVVFIIWELTL